MRPSATTFLPSLKLTAIQGSLLRRLAKEPDRQARVVPGGAFRCNRITVRTLMDVGFVESTTIKHNRDPYTITLTAKGAAWVQAHP